MPTDQQVIQALIEGIERQSDHDDPGTQIDQKGGAAVADRNSRIDLRDAKIGGTTVTNEVNIISSETADDAIALLTELKEEIKKDDPDEDAIAQCYDWFSSEIPLVASTLSILESVSSVIPA